MKVIVSPRAAEEILLRKKWWRTHRPDAAPRFDEELADALARIGQRPESFPRFSEHSGRLVRRCLLKTTRCHLYFEVVTSSKEVLVVAARGAVQRQSPRIG